MLMMNELWRDHFRTPRGAGWFDDGDTGIRDGEAGSVHHGAVVQFGLKCGTDGRIAEARFKAWGCAGTIACASMVAEWAAGRGLDEARTLDVQALTAPLELPPERMYAALVVEDALKAASGVETV
jgi:nitrogen fixation protein NifU and related proteins